MRISPEKLIAPAVLLAATSTGSWLEVPFGSFGISIEHILLLIYLCFLIFQKISHTKLEFGFVAMVTLILSILGAVIIQPANAHLGSLVVLCLMFPLFIRYFENVANPQQVVIFAFSLLAIQCIFFSHESLEYQTHWDNVMVPGFGVFQRLAILGFVSNSFGLMLLPFYIFFLNQYRTIKKDKVLNLLMCLVVLGLIVATFSRTAIVCVVFLTLLMLGFKELIFVATISLLGAVVDPLELISSVLLAINREQDISENARVYVWIKALTNWGGSDIFTGSGLQNPALDNTYLSIVIGAGSLGLFALIIFFISLARWLNRIRKTLPLTYYRLIFGLIGAILISANTFDIFSQRKIIFGFALVLGALLANAKNLHLRR